MKKKDGIELKKDRIQFTGSMLYTIQIKPFEWTGKGISFLRRLWNLITFVPRYLFTNELRI